MLMPFIAMFYRYTFGIIQSSANKLLCFQRFYRASDTIL